MASKDNLALKSTTKSHQHTNPLLIEQLQDVYQIPPLHVTNNS